MTSINAQHNDLAGKDEPPSGRGFRVDLPWLVSAGCIAMSVGGYLTTINSLGSRMQKVEEVQQRQQDTLYEMRGDVKLLLERTISHSPSK